MARGLKKGQCNNRKGRPKGIPDIRTFYINTLETLERMGHNPIEALVLIAKDETLDVAHRIKANISLADKASPSLKKIEHKKDETQHKELMEELKKAMADLIGDHKRDY